MNPAIQDAITRAAQEEGVDPAFALAVASRESNFDPNATASRSIYGLFQMSGGLRSQYGAGDSNDPYTQAKGWSRFINNTKANLTQRLGRDPTNDELYLAHYFGEGRAARLIGGQVAPSTSVADVFTPSERRINPNFDRAGTVGNLTSSISADMEARQAKFGGPQKTDIDFAQFGQPEDGRADSPDFSIFGVAEPSAKALKLSQRAGGSQVVGPEADNANVAGDVAKLGNNPVNGSGPVAAGASNGAIGQGESKNLAMGGEGDVVGRNGEGQAFAPGAGAGMAPQIGGRLSYAPESVSDPAPFQDIAHSLSLPDSQSSDGVEVDMTQFPSLAANAQAATGLQPGIAGQ